jgi:hypothetical protein
MPRFSERLGLAPARTKIQTDALDVRTRTLLWNVFRRLLIEPLARATQPWRTETWCSGMHIFLADLGSDLCSPRRNIPRVCS